MLGRVQSSLPFRKVEVSPNFILFKNRNELRTDIKATRLKVYFAYRHQRLYFFIRAMARRVCRAFVENESSCACTADKLKFYS